MIIKGLEQEAFSFLFYAQPWELHVVISSLKQSSNPVPITSVPLSRT